MVQRQFVRLNEDSLHGPESTVPTETLRAHDVQVTLRPYLSNILSYRETFAPGQEVEERVIPDGAVRLVVNLDKSPSSDDARCPPMLVLGASATPSRVKLRGDAHGLATTLHPGAAEALLGVPAGEIAGAVVALDALWPRHCGALMSRLVEQTSDVARIDVLQSELARRLRRATPAVHRTTTHALRLIVGAAGQVSVRDVAAAVGIGERRLQQLFNTHIGLSPSAWRRLARFHGCLRALRRQANPDWSDVALKAGYYDQSHLINECQALCGCTPIALRREAISGSSKIAI